MTPRDVTLGLTLGGREVGLVVADRERLHHHQILNLRKLCSREAKEMRFRQVVALRADRHAVTRIAIVAPWWSGQSELADAQLAWLRAWVGEGTRVVEVYTRHDVRLAPRGRQTNRSLADGLARRFPELWLHAPEAEVAPGADRVPGLRRRTVSSRERYWRPMFIALGAALHDLDRALTKRIA